MKASNLIELLQEKIKDYWDMQVYISSDPEWNRIREIHEIEEFITERDIEEYWPYPEWFTIRPYEKNLLDDD